MRGIKRDFRVPFNVGVYMKKVIRENRLNIILETMFILSNIYILYCYVVSDMLVIEGSYRFALVILSIVVNSIYIMYRLYRIEETKSDKIMFWTFIFADIYTLSLSYLLYDKTYIDRIGVLFLINTIYRVYDMCYYGEVTPFSNTTLFIVFIFLISGFIIIDDQLYNVILAIVTFLIGAINEKSLDTIYDLGLSGTNMKFNDKKFTYHKFNLLKIILSIYPAIFISNFILRNFSEFIGISIFSLNFSDQILFSEIRVAIFGGSLMVINFIFREENIKKILKQNYIIENEVKNESENNSRHYDQVGSQLVNETSKEEKVEVFSKNTKKFIGFSFGIFLVYSVIKGFIDKNE